MEYSFKLGPENAGARLDQAVSGMIPDFSRSRVKKIIEAGGCRVNGEKVLSADSRLAGNEEIQFEAPETNSVLVPETGQLKIIWQDDDLAVCDKPPALVTHPCPSYPQNTLVNRLLSAFPKLAEQGGERPGIVHRLDKDTSGLLLVALTERARLKLAEEFADRNVEKEYLALVAGVPPESGECLEPLGRHPTLKTKMAIVPEAKGGKAAHSRWRRLWAAPDKSISLLAVRIFTGRTHQIRVHMAHAGHPLLGDSLYAPAHVKNMAPRQMLHAWRLALKHPQTGKNLCFQTIPPDDFRQVALTHACPPMPIIITGSQGSGKSTFCGLLRKLDMEVVSADAIVASLYAGKGHVADWLEQRFGRDLLNNDGSVNKPALLSMFQQQPAMRAEFEKMVHALVLDEIERFWAEHWRAGQFNAAAEVPLYFESGWNRTIQPKPFVVGIHCPTAERWQRIRANRGWSQDKIATIEKWQLPEERKMKNCDMVVNNANGQDDLAAQAKKVVEAIEEMRKDCQKTAAKKFAALWGETYYDSGS